MFRKQDTELTDAGQIYPKLVAIAGSKSVGLSIQHSKAAINFADIFDQVTEDNIRALLVSGHSLTV